MLRVNCFTLTLDGYGAGLTQSANDPLGVGGLALHEWIIQTKTFQQMVGNETGTVGIDDDFTARGLENIGAWIIGRNMFGPIRGDWPDDDWRGWWGDNPPYHTPVFVLTHYPRPSLVMEGGTTFHFVCDGIRAALNLACNAAGDKDVRIGGGVATIRAYLEARLVDELHVVFAPTMLGSGEHLFTDIDVPGLGYEVTEFVPTAKTAHVVLTRRK